MNYEEMKAGKSNAFNTNTVESDAPKNSENEGIFKNVTPQVTIDVHSWAFKIAAIGCIILGLIVGIVSGFVFPVTEVEGVYFERVEETFNWVMMLGVWISFGILSLSFWGLYCHLENQEETIKQLKFLNSKIK